jgi:predicted house-cleaning noncanonical NTP pyrophosphatase (MazG superfamily)
MPLYQNNRPAITQTERGLTVSGTKITLYQMMDYIHAGYPRHLIRHQFYLTDEQFDGAMSYIDTHYEEVESEYQTVLQQAEEIQDYWQEKNKERLANISKLPPKPEYASAWQKLQARKAKRAVNQRILLHL